MVRYSTALSHIFLSGTGLYCLKTLNRYRLPFAKVSFGVIVFNSLLGIWRWGNPTYGDKVDKFYKFTLKLQDVLVLPGIVTTIWLKYSYSQELACAHTIVSLLPLIIYLYDDKKQEVMDGLLGGNIFSLAVVSYYHENFYGITTAMSYILNYFLIKRNVIVNFPLEVPTQDLFNYSMCFFAFFALKAVLEPLY